MFMCLRIELMKETFELPPQLNDTAQTEQGVPHGAPRGQESSEGVLLTKEEVMNILIGRQTGLPTNFPFDYFRIDDIPKELQQTSPLEKRVGLEKIPYYSFSQAAETATILKLHENDIHYLNMNEAVETTRRLLTEVPLEKWKERGLIMDVVFYHDNSPWTVSVFKYEDTPLIAKNHLNIRWYKVIRYGEPLNENGKPITPGGSIICL